MLAFQQHQPGWEHLEKNLLLEMCPLVFFLKVPLLYVPLQTTRHCSTKKSPGATHVTSWAVLPLSCTPVPASPVPASPVAVLDLFLMLLVSGIIKTPLYNFCFIASRTFLINHSKRVTAVKHTQCKNLFLGTKRTSWAKKRTSWAKKRTALRGQSGQIQERGRTAQDVTCVAPGLFFVLQCRVVCKGTYNNASTANQ